MTSVDDMYAHYAQLLDAGHLLAHAVIDDGCSCDTQMIFAADGALDYDAMRERDERYRRRGEDNRCRWGLHNPHTEWGFDVRLAVAVLHGTPHQRPQIPLPLELAGRAWPHPPLRDVAIGGEVELAAKIDELEAAVAALLDQHTQGLIELHDAPQTVRVRQLLAGTAWSY